MSEQQKKTPREIAKSILKSTGNQTYGYAFLNAIEQAIQAERDELDKWRPLYNATIDECAVLCEENAKFIRILKETLETIHSEMCHSDKLHHLLCSKPREALSLIMKEKESEKK